MTEAWTPYNLRLSRIEGQMKRIKLYADAQRKVLNEEFEKIWGIVYDLVSVLTLSANMDGKKELEGDLDYLTDLLEEIRPT